MTEDTNRKASKKKYYLIYSGIFLFCVGSYILYLVLNGKTNINATSDGMNQHYRALLFYSRHLKNIVKTFLTTGKFEAPLWSFSIGEGSDIIQVLHADAVGDPITFLSVFVPERYMYVFYMFSAALRIYLGGVFFSELCFYTGIKNRIAMLAGTIVYCFGFWALKNFTLHIYFLTPFMYFPLLILGLEKILKNDSPITFVIAVFLGSISWFYFFYIEAVMTALYGFIRAFVLFKTDIKTILKKMFITLGYALLGVMMAAVVLGPIVYAYLGDRRIGIEHPVPALYSYFTYLRLYVSFVGNDYPFDLELGFAAPTLLALSLIVKDPKKHPTVFISIVLCIIFVCIPVFGYMLNGFAYVSQRWSFAIALPVAYSVVVTWDDLKENKNYLLLAVFGVFCLSMTSPWSRNERGFVPVAFVIVFYLIAHMNIDRKIKAYYLKDILLVILLVMNVFFVGQYHLSKRGKDIFTDLLSIEDAKNLTSSSEAGVIKEYTKDDKDFYRYSGNYLTNNAAILYDVHSTNFYWSITNSNDQSFRMKMDLRDRFSNQINGYDDRAELESLANVKYYITPDSYKGTVPFGFDKVDVFQGSNIYLNQYCLPFGYTYRNSVSYDKWNALDSLEKQETIMQAVVVDDPKGDFEPDLDQISDLDYSIVCGEGIEVDGHQIRVTKEDSEMSILFSGEKDLENYFSFQGINFVDTENVIEDEADFTWIDVASSNGFSYSVQYLPYGHRYNYGKTDYMFYFGNSEDEYNSINVTFQLPGIYEFEQIRVIQKSMDRYPQFIGELCEDRLEDVLFEANHISGTIDLKEEKYLLLSIPYSKGWSARIDGQDAAVLKANEHYIALCVPTGEHRIDLYYVTPGLEIGTVISAVSFAVFGYVIYHHRRKRSTE